MRIFDCFTFYNELDLLEIRLKELYNTVDVFVIVEGTSTFTNRARTPLFPQHYDRFKPYADKIRYLPVNLPGDPNPWVNEEAQRNAILHCLTDAEDDDIMIVSDVDEIPRPAAVEYIRQSDQIIFAMRMTLSNFKFNYMRFEPARYDVWAMAGRGSVFKEITPNQLRNFRFNFFGAEYQHKNQGCEVIEHAGWHFGYMGDNDYLRDKAQSFSHTEVNTPEFLAQIDLDKSIAEGKEWNRSADATYKIVDLDNYFPASCRQYTDFILANSGEKIIDFLPPYPYNK
jgi:hypothetical protein